VHLHSAPGNLVKCGRACHKHSTLWLEPGSRVRNGSVRRTCSTLPNGSFARRHIHLVHRGSRQHRDRLAQPLLEPMVVQQSSGWGNCATIISLCSRYWTRFRFLPPSGQLDHMSSNVRLRRRRSVEGSDNQPGHGRGLGSDSTA
jgi:hypothetical protein